MFVERVINYQLWEITDLTEFFFQTGKIAKEIKCILNTFMCTFCISIYVQVHIEMSDSVISAALLSLR